MSNLPNSVQLNSQFTVCPQIEPTDVAQIIALGYKSIINNRPDNEAANQPQNSEIAKIAQKLGIPYYYHPVVGSAITEEQVYKMAELLLKMPQPVFAFCRSGARCTTIYNLAQKLIAEQTIDAGE